jgi:hypothetical protein
VLLKQSQFHAIARHLGVGQRFGTRVAKFVIRTDDFIHAAALFGGVESKPLDGTQGPAAHLWDERRAQPRF